MYKIGCRAIYQKDIYNAIKEAKEFGFQVLELHCNAPKFSPENYSKKERIKIKRFAKKNNIILQTHAPLELSLIFTNSHLRKSARLCLKNLVAFTQDIGARCLTLHPGKAAMYNIADGKKLKDDDVYPEYYLKLFEDSIKYIMSIAKKDVFICIENTDNFTPKYMQVLSKYLLSGKIFLTLDIMKCYTYTDIRLIKSRWEFFKKNKKYVKNIHVSGSMHSGLDGWEKKIEKFFHLINNPNLPVIVEILPTKDAVGAKKLLDNLNDK